MRIEGEMFKKVNMRKELWKVGKVGRLVPLRQTFLPSRARIVLLGP